MAHALIANPGAHTGSFVINLCAVSVPITVPQPRSPQLARFRFFLSDRREGGRRRYRLQMGYFASLAEARKWLKILRGTYPSAFISEASAADTDSLSDIQVLAILEQRRPAADSFAVQLQWSELPIDLEQTPRDAIFNTYTLYTTQVHDEGRQWFALRLGFFSDAISARQVAQYVAPDFASAAVVPVTPREQATAETHAAHSG